MINKEASENEIVCDCLPQCSYISYKGSTEMVFYKNMTGIHDDSSAIRVYFQNSWCMKYKMLRQLETNSFIAIIGGLFSLCLGGSILSLIELISAILKTCMASFKMIPAEDKNTKIYPQLYWGELYRVPEKKYHDMDYSDCYEFVN